jgi:hypothetical protein
VWFGTPAERLGAESRTLGSKWEARIVMVERVMVMGNGAILIAREEVIHVCAYELLTVPGVV